MVGWRFVTEGGSGSGTIGETGPQRHWITSKGPALCKKAGAPSGSQVPIGEVGVEDDDPKNCRMCQNILKRIREEVPHIVEKYKGELEQQAKERAEFESIRTREDEAEDTERS